MFGLVTFIAVDGIAALLDPVDVRRRARPTRSGAAAFLYLEVLDASFSFDGVIGAFALSNNLFVIAIGLGIGAMFVRSLTIMLVERGTLTEYRYLEHGAFYAIIALGVIMFVKTVTPVPETVTGSDRSGLHRRVVPALMARQSARCSRARRRASAGADESTLTELRLRAA